MTAFKEIKKRINSIKNTRKTTAAMKMVSSSKLRKAESVISNMLPYSAALHHVMESLLTGDEVSDLSRERPVNNVAIIAFSSDSSLCGAFNSNIARELQKAVGIYGKSLPADRIAVYTIGRKIYDAVGKTDIKVTKNFEDLAGKADYQAIADLAESLIAQFENGETDRVDMIYHHFKSAGVQELVHEALLPVALPRKKDADSRILTEYIYEPSREEILRVIIPKSIKLQLYTALLDSNASEHAARMIAMQTATDNADDLISELTVEYNKSRQQAITNELLDLFNGNIG
ncbi:MAG: ATP synthase F1 subunit gamma [Tannerella sp.]|jgi:F-type H+-transporting ATPase subunit gamma|nr:ATP synthase F1 subunit gamma [Tannerella sp.]